MSRKEQIVVGRARLPFWISLLDPRGDLVHRQDAHVVNGFQKRNPKFSVSDDKHNPVPAFPRHNEVKFSIANPHSVVDILRSLIDERPTIQGPWVQSFLSSTLSFSELRFNLAAVHTPEVPVDTLF